MPNNTFMIIMFASSLILFLLTIIDKKEIIKERQKIILLNKQITISKMENEEKSKMISYISHELRTPIIGIRGLIEIALQNINNTKKLEEMLEKVERSVRYMNLLIDDVLDICKLKSGNMIVKNNVVNIKEVLDNCIMITNERFYDRKVEYIKCFENVEHYNLFVDEMRIKQVFINLLSNAVKYTSDGGCIIFKVKELEHEKINNAERIIFQFQIIDTGIGMNKVFLENIWNEFAQDDNQMCFKIL